MRASISEQILSAAGTLFYREGIRAVGIDRIIEEAGVAKATLYRHFPSKDHLVAAYLEDRHHRVMRSLIDVINLVETPRGQISTIFERLHDKADSPEFRGCAFALAVAEHGDSERIVAIAQEHKKSVLALFAQILATAGIEAPQHAMHLAILYEGALSTVAVRRDSSIVLIARDCAMAVFDTAVQSTSHAAEAL